MTAMSCRLQLESDADARTVAEVIAQQVDEAAPLLAWAEPNPLYAVVHNRTGRRGDFVPLVQGAPSWPADLPLIEARLFWPTAALHVVAREGRGCLWTRIEELNAAAGAASNAEFMRTVFPVHTISDRARFGLPDQETITPLQAIEYRQCGRLVAWRLTIGTEEYRHA